MPETTVHRPMTANRPTRWYRQFWPWFVIGLLLWGISSSLITLSFAVRNPPQMMTGDYARLGKALIDTHVRADRAEAMGLSGMIERDAQGWVMRLKANDPAMLDEQLLLIVQHPIDVDQDRSILMKRVSAQDALTYRADVNNVPERGRLIVSNVTQEWWISSTYQRQADTSFSVQLRPERL